MQSHPEHIKEMARLGDPIAMEAIRMNDNRLPRLDDGTLAPCAWPGMYPLVYLDADNNALCPTCANESDTDPDFGPECKPVTAFIHYEGTPIVCDECYTDIESAYGDPE